MKRILLAIIIVLSLVGCTQKTKEQYIPFYLDPETNTTFYIATPSGFVYYATNSEIKIWHTTDGKTININDYKGE